MTGAPPSATPRLDATIAALAFAIVTLLLMLSPMALGALGWNYDGPGGSGPTRFHPATYLALPTVLLLALRAGNPLAGLATLFLGDARIALFLVAWSIILYHGVARQGLPAAAPIDTFLLPLLAFLIVTRLAPRHLAGIAVLIHAVFALNALVGLGEFATGLRLTPYVAGGNVITGDWRSTALLGHPLGNALLTGCYTAILLIGGGLGLRGWRRPAMITLQFAGMIAFGGRASLVLLVLILAGRLALGLFAIATGARASLRAVTVAALIVPLGLLALGVAVEGGFFDKFLLRFTEDKGSAEARIVMFELFRGFTWPELLLGPSQEQLGYLTQIYRLEYGIESLWVAFSLYYGILPAIVFFAGLAFFLFAVMARCERKAWIVLIYFFIVNSTFLGLAGKTVGFTTLTIMLVTLLPASMPHVQPARRASSLPARAAPC